MTGLEPARLPTWPSTMRVCLFRHIHTSIMYYRDIEPKNQAIIFEKMYRIKNLTILMAIFI